MPGRQLACAESRRARRRRALNLDQWLGLGRELQSCSSAQIVLSSLTLIDSLDPEVLSPWLWRNLERAGRGLAATDDERTSVDNGGFAG